MLSKANNLLHNIHTRALYLTEFQNKILDLFKVYENFIKYKIYLIYKFFEKLGKLVIITASGVNSILI